MKVRVVSWLGFKREEVAVERIMKKDKYIHGAEEPLETSEGELRWLWF